MRDVSAAALLSELGTFSEVPVELLWEIGASAEMVELDAGAVLVEEGAPADSAYILVSGTLSVTRRGRDQHFPVAELDAKGTVVGEVAVLAGGRRTATVCAVVPTRLVRISSQEFERLLDAAPILAVTLAEDASARMEQSELLSFLAGILGTDDAQLLVDLAEAANWLHIPGGSLLFEAGEEADAVYMVVSGRLGAMDPNSDFRAEIGRGEVVGELGLLEQSVRSLSVRALRDSVLVRIPTAAFEAALERRPQLALQIARTVVRRAREPRRARSGSMVVAVAVVGRLDREAVLSGLSAQLARLGATEHLGAQRAEALLGRRGAAEAGPGDPAELRVVSLMHELELSCSHLLLEADGGGPGWETRCLRHADRVVVATAADPTPEERVRIRGLLAGANQPEGRLLLVVQGGQLRLPAGSAQLAAEVGADRIINVRQVTPAEMARVARVITGEASCLVLSGGGARGFAHVGAYKAMQELGIPVDWVGGSSIGSVFAALIALDFSPPEIERLAERLFKGVLDYTLPLVALVKGSKISAHIEEMVGNADIEDLWRSFFCVSTNLTRSRRQLHDRGPLGRSIRASVAIPGVIPPVPWGEDLLVDGGVMDNLPVGLMRALQPGGTIIAIDLAPSVGPRAKSDYGLYVSGWRALAAKGKRSASVYPSIAAVLMRSMITASESQRSTKRSDSDLYIDLDLRGVGILDFEVVRPVVLAGYEQAMPRLEEWLRTRGEADY